MSWCTWSADADSLSAQRQRLSALQAQAEANRGQLQQDETQAQQINQSLAAYQTALTTLQQSLRENQARINATQARLAEIHQAMANNQQQLETTQEQFETQLRAMYETGSIPYLEVLLGATNFDDFVNRLYAIATVAETNRQLARRLTGLEQQLAQEQATQKDAMAQLQQEQQQLKETQAMYSELVARQQEALREVKLRVGAEQHRQALLESQIRLTQSQMEEIERETRQIEASMRSRAATPIQMEPSARSQASTPVSRAALPAANTSSLVAYAESFIGIPYTWGGTSPDTGFDCSGFTQYVFGHFGVHLGRTALDQFGEGVPVDINQLQPGDLVFFSTYAPGATHVGIYIGNGQMVDAQDEGVTIASIYSSYWASRYIGARRVLSG